jgi:hypothetical protein
MMKGMNICNLCFDWYRVMTQRTLGQGALRFLL